ncbi:hypothetical protein BJ742DRAFT_870748 [Cladochytrium replicatum]|nr:hypothetical protein BJ742DRAFT_870748 [Cladochytrium replicatum]
MSTVPAATSPFDRSFFVLVNSGFALGFCIKYGIIIASRRSQHRDKIPGYLLGCWFVYVLIQVIDMWSKKSSGVIPNYGYVLNLSTLLYSACLCGIAYMSVVRILALSISRHTSVLRRIAYIVIGVMFGVRVIRSCLAFAVTVQTSSGNTESATHLGGIVAVLQFLTLLPILVGRTILDVLSTYQLWKARVKYMDYGRDAFYTIVLSLIFETLLSMVALIVAAEEALIQYFGVSIPNTLAVADWLLISWCMASWIEQRPLYRQIFNQPDSSKPTSTGNNKSGLNIVAYNGHLAQHMNNGASSQNTANLSDQSTNVGFPIQEPPHYQGPNAYPPQSRSPGQGYAYPPQQKGQGYLGGGGFQYSP